MSIALENPQPSDFQEIVLQDSDRAYLHEEAIRCGVSVSAKLHEIIEHYRVAFSESVRDMDLDSAIDDESLGPIEEDPIWHTVGTGMGDGSPVSSNVKDYLYGPAVA